MIGTILERKCVGGSSWQIQIRQAGNKPVFKTFREKKDAKAFLRLMEANAINEALSAKNAPPTQASAADFYNESFNDVIADYMESPACTKRDIKTLRTVRANLRSVKISELRRPFLKAYVDKMLAKNTRVGRPFQPSTLAIHLGIMSKVLRWRAEELDVQAPPSPFSTRLLPKDWDHERDRRLTIREEKALQKEMKAPNRLYGDHWRLLMRLALETGARLQELVLAEWSEFDMEAGLWRIPKDHTKTREARIVSLGRRARRAMRCLWNRRSPTSQRVFHCFRNPDSVSAGFHKISCKAGLVDFRFHDFRHEAISRMVMSKKKISPFIIMKMVGHKSSEMLSRYANLSGDDLTGIFD